MLRYQSSICENILEIGPYFINIKSDKLEGKMHFLTWKRNPSFLTAEIAKTAICLWQLRLCMKVTPTRSKDYLFSKTLPIMTERVFLDLLLNNEHESCSRFFAHFQNCFWSIDSNVHIVLQLLFNSSLGDDFPIWKLPIRVLSSAELKTELEAKEDRSWMVQRNRIGARAYT